MSDNKFFKVGATNIKRAIIWNISRIYYMYYDNKTELGI